MGKTEQYSWISITFLVMILLVVVAAFSVKGCAETLQEVVSTLSTIGSYTPNTNSGGDDTSPPPTDPVDADDEVVCDWEVIDSGDYLVLSGLMSEWKTDFPTGSFSYAFECDQRVDATLTSAFASIEHQTNVYDGEFSFAGAGLYGLVISNPTMYNAQCRMTLEQWICSDDPKNWNPNVFSAPHTEQQFSQVDCWTECLDIGFYGGSSIPSETTEVDCAEWGNSVVGVCCCFVQPPIMAN